MSRAFVKESEGDEGDEPRPARHRGDHPPYITAAGFARLQQRMAALSEEIAELKAREDAVEARRELARLEAEARDITGTLQEAEPIEVTAQEGALARFGATVELVDEHGADHVFTIVGAEEAEPGAGRISWVSPLARALLGKEPGETLTWELPDGNLELEITDVRYVA